MITRQSFNRIAPALLLGLLAFAAPALGAKETFDGDIGGMEKLTIYGYLEHRPEGGNPGGYLRFDGQDTFGVLTKAAAFTGDYAAQGHEQIACDLTVYLFQMTNFRPQIVLRAGPSVPAWYYALTTFQPVANEWRHYTAPIDPSWTDAEAMAHGWQRDSGPEFSFADTLRQVKLAGIRIPYPPITSATLGLDNFYLGKTPVPPKERLRPKTVPLGDRKIAPRTLPTIKR